MAWSSRLPVPPFLWRRRLAPRRRRRRGLRCWLKLRLLSWRVPKWAVLILARDSKPTRSSPPVRCVQRLPIPMTCTSTRRITFRKTGVSAHPGVPAHRAFITGWPNRPCRARAVHAIYSCPAYGALTAPKGISIVWLRDRVAPCPVAQGTDRACQALSAGAGLAAFPVAGDYVIPLPPGDCPSTFVHLTIQPALLRRPRARPRLLCLADPPVSRSTVTPLPLRFHGA